MSLVFSPLAVIANETGTSISKTQIVESHTKQSHQTEASVWSLSPEEWTRYVQLKQGLRGYWSPNLDPVAMLGVEARTEKERQHFAQLYAEQQWERVEKELAFERARLQAARTLAQGISVIDPMLLPSASTLPSGDSQLEAGDTVKWFLSSEQLLAKQPDQTLQRLIKTIQEGQKLNIDVHFVGMVDHDHIREWAQHHEIPHALVANGVVTLIPTPLDFFQQREPHQGWFLVRNQTWHQLDFSPLF